ncbi:unnamed protein product, partial [Laminaria digitata]
SGGGGGGTAGDAVDAGVTGGRVDLTLSANTVMLSPNAVMLSPGTDSDRGSTPSPGALARPELFGVGVGAATGGGGGGGGGGGAAGAAAAAGRRAAEVDRPFSPWVTTRAGARSGGATPSAQRR